MKNKLKILVTGGGGFIGSAFLVNSTKEMEVISLDHGTNYPKLKSIVPSNVELVQGSLNNEDLLDEILRGVEVIIHFAGGGGNRACLEDPTKSLLNNVLGTRLLLKKALQYKIKRFFFASTQSVYGTFSEREMPLVEKKLQEPDDFYAALKTCAEATIMDLFNNYVIFRFANVYGYGSGLGAQWGGVIGKFIKSGCDNAEISVFGTGEQKIDFVHINDVVKVLLLTLGNQTIKSEIINVGSGKGTSIKEVGLTVAHVAQRNYNRSVNINYKPAPPDKIWPDRWLSINKAKELLHWQPQVSLEEGVNEMMNKYLNASK